MKLGYIIIYVPDVVQTIEFYEKAFGLVRGFVHENSYGELSTGSTALAFASEEMRSSNGLETLDNRPDVKPAGVEIALVAGHVQEAYEHAVASGAMPLKPPQKKPWGQIVAYVRDCNGFLVELCSPVS